MLKTKLYLDSQNFIHRARSGFTEGENSIVYNFFRNFRALVNSFSPVSEIYFVLEGKPVEKEIILETYKQNRKIDVSNLDDPKIKEALEKKIDFFRQVDIIHKILVDAFPVKICRHAEFECDDTLYNLIRLNSKHGDNHIVISNDTDFIQLLNEFENVSIYNPMKKVYVEKPRYDYAMWKSLTGDKSDNIPGIPGIGTKRAEQLMLNLDKLREFFEKDTNNFALFQKNYSLIKFKEWNDEEFNSLKILECKLDESCIKTSFNDLGFESITSEKSWEKFINTFKQLDN